MFESLELRSGQVVLEEAVVGLSSTEVASTATGVHGYATKASGCTRQAGAGQAGAAGRRRLCNTEVVCPRKACFDLKLRLHVLHNKPEQCDFVGRRVASWPFGNITKRRKGSVFCRVSIAACRC